MTDQQQSHNNSDEPEKLSSENLPSEKVLAEPRTVQPKGLRFSLVWIIPLVALAIGLSLVVKVITDTGPTIHVSFRSADGLQAGKTTVRYKEVDIGLVKNIGLSDDHSHVVVTIELSKSASSFAVDDARFWVVRPRIGTGGISGISTLLSGAYIGVDGGKSQTKREDFTGLESPPAIAADVPGKTYTLQSSDLGSLDIGSPIYYRRINVGQVSGYKLADDGKSVQLQIFIQAPYDRYVTTDTRFWHASGLDVSLNASGFKVNTQSLASIVSGGIAFGFPENSDAEVAASNASFNLAQTQEDALKESDGKPIRFMMYFDQSLRGLTKGSVIDFRGIELGYVQSINVEFDATYRQLRMPVVAVVYPSRLSHGREFDPNQKILAEFIQRGLRAQMRTGNILTGQNYIALDFFPKAKPAELKFDKGMVEIPTTPTELSNLQAQVTQIADKLTKFPLDEIGQDLRKTMANMNTTIDSTNQLMKQMDGKVAPAMQATLDDARKTMQSTQTLLASDAPMQQDIRRAMQQMTRAAASLQLMSDYIEQHPESLIRGKAPSLNKNQDKNQDKSKP
ncbi:MAG: MCE family protein [Gammaproteobacteria bacterium]|nr:MCE family protein [Gammaproteobacteria bacterium]